MDMEKLKSLRKFYEGKSHDEPGGSMFRVYDRAEHMGNWWGRSLHELRIFLNSKHITFTRIEALI